MTVAFLDDVGPQAVIEHVEIPAIHVVRVSLASHVTYVLQPGDLLLDEQPIPRRFRSSSPQRTRLRPVHGRVSTDAAATVPSVQPQRP